MPWFGNGFGEFVDNDGPGDAAVGGDRECVAGVIVDPAQNFGVGAVGEGPVGEVSLPEFVGLFGGKTDVGRFGAFLRAGCDEPGRGEVAADGGRRNSHVVVMVEVPGDGVGSGVESFAGQLVAHLEDQLDGGLRQSGRAVVGRRDRGWNAVSPSSV